MPSATSLDPNNLQFLERLWQTHPAGEDLLEFFAQNPADPLLDAWLQSKLIPLTQEGQRFLRLARAAHCHRTHGIWREMLVAWPLALLAPPTTEDGWRLARAQAQDGLASALADLDAVVQLTETPVSCEALAQVGPTSLSTWVDALHHHRDPSRAIPPPAQAEPCVWVALVKVPVEHAAELERLLSTLNPDISRLSRSMAMRMEALMEEQGARLRIFPPTALWNAASIARLAFARQRLARARRTRGKYLVYQEGTVVKVFHDGQLLLEQDFPEELPSDWAPLFSGWTSVPNLAASKELARPVRPSRYS